MIGISKEKSKGLLGMNARNLLFIDKKATVISNSKIRSKKRLKDFNIPVSKTIATIKNLEEFENFDFSSLPLSFVLKPNRGLGGEGIVIVYGKKKKKYDEEDSWIMPNKEVITLTKLKSHILDILNGNFSINPGNDIALFEERIKVIPLFSKFTRQGLPDIRIIVYRNIPIMAECRIPTIESKGKANLHSGGVGVGIDIANGITTNAILKDSSIEVHPDTGERLSGIKIPYWNKILEMSILSSLAIDAKFLGVDIAIDKNNGPLILEVNARPGLAIQIANNDGLKERLLSVSKIKTKNPQSSIRIAKEIFGGEIEEEVSEITGKIIIGKKVKVLIGNMKIPAEAKIDSGAYRSSISEDIAKKIGYNKVLEKFNKIEMPLNLNIGNINIKEEELKKKYHMNLKSVRSANGFSIRPVISTSLEFCDTEIEFETELTIAQRSYMRYPIIIGRKDLSNFLLDVTK
ncbi:MAG: sugar-transfer associated ATP-grasp domain-containing protein [Patescibacteria group bacterium]